METSINYLAVLAAGVLAYAVGAIWYSPVGFGKQWMKMMHLSKDDMGKMPLTATQAYILGFFFTLLTSYVFAHFVVLVGVTNVSSALTLGFWLWLGFGFTTLAHGWLYEGRALKLFLFNAAHLFVAIEAMALVLGWWR